MLKNAISMHSDAVFGSKNVQYSCSEYETFVKHRIFQKWNRPLRALRGRFTKIRQKRKNLQHYFS